MSSFLSLRRFVHLAALLGAGLSTTACMQAHRADVKLPDGRLHTTVSVSDANLFTAAHSMTDYNCGGLVIRTKVRLDGKSPVIDRMKGASSRPCIPVGNGMGVGPGLIPAVSNVAAAAVGGHFLVQAAKSMPGTQITNVNDNKNINTQTQLNNQQTKVKVNQSQGQGQSQSQGKRHGHGMPVPPTSYPN